MIHYQNQPFFHVLKHHSAKLKPVRTVMRVYVFVAIILHGVSFCFAVRLGEKACTIGRDPLCTPAYKAYTISNRALRHNVALLENMTHVDGKEKEARMQNLDNLKDLKESGIFGDVIGKMQSALNLPLCNNLDKLQREELVAKKPQLIDKLQKTLAESTAIKFDELIDKWFHLIKIHKDVYQNLGKSSNDFDDALLSALSNVSKLLTENASMSLVMVLLETYRAKPEFQSLAEDLERLMLFVPGSKPLVFQNWMENGNSLANVRRILVGQEPIGFNNPFFWVCFDYLHFVWYHSVAVSKSNYAKFYQFLLRSGLTESDITTMLDRPEFRDRFMPGLADYIIVRRTWYSFQCLKAGKTPAVALKEINDYQKSASDADELISSLTYANTPNQFKERFQYFDIDLYRFLTSNRQFDMVIRLLKLSKNLPKSFSEMACNMLYSMITDKDVVTALKNTGTTFEQYKQYFADLKAVYPKSKPTKVATSQSLVIPDDDFWSKLNNYDLIATHWNAPTDQGHGYMW
ncbi:hypothetical protein Plhal304r1_c031g0101741 [Plasmopara halstedii]